MPTNLYADESGPIASLMVASGEPASTQRFVDPLTRALEMMVQALSAESGSIYLLDEHGMLVMRTGCSLHAGLVDIAKYQIGEGITGSIATGRTVNIAGYDELRAYEGRVGKYDAAIWPNSNPRLENLLGLPIVLEGKILGVVKLENLKPSPQHPASHFTEHDVQIGQTLSSFLAYQIDSEQFRGNLVSDLRLLAKSSIGIEKATSEEDAILAVMLALEESEFSESILSLYDRDSRQIRGHLASKSIKVEAVSSIKVDINSDGMLADVLHSNKPLFVKSTASERASTSGSDDILGWGAQYVIPLKVEDEPLGTLQIHMGAAETIGEDEELILQAFAGHLAISISRARSIERSVNLTNQVMSGSRFIVAETLSAMAVHSLGHKLDDILTRLDEDLKKREIRERRELLHTLTEWRDLLTAGQRDLRGALKFVRSAGPSEFKQIVDVHLAVQEILDTWIALIRQNKCVIHHSFQATDCKGMMTPHAFAEVLAVLIVNAVQAHAKRIEIRTSNQMDVDLPNHNYVSRAIVLEFEDDGIGLATDKPEEIFEATYTSKPEKFGTGLGLFIARRLSRQSGGDLTFLGKGKKGTGAVFQLVMPVG